MNKDRTEDIFQEHKGESLFGNKNVWELFQQQKEEPWAFEDFDEFREYYFKEKNRLCRISS